jgi:hypothetical protein
MERFADDWVTSGWSKIGGRWIELGQSASVSTDTPEIPPQLRIHDVAAILNRAKV